jgi:hypothetical protein
MELNLYLSLLRIIYKNVQGKKKKSQPKTSVFILLKLGSNYDNVKHMLTYCVLLVFDTVGSCSLLNLNLEMESQPEFTVSAYKRKFDKDLRHVKVMMMSKKNTMTKHAWIRFVMTTKKTIIAHPENYFRSTPPKPDIFKQAIDEVFQGFLNDQKIRDAQKRL